MGFLHEGHASLIRRSTGENEVTAVSIFVNPTQFNQTDDFEKYPRNMEKDLALLDSLGVDAVFIPDSEIVYPPGYDTWVTVEGLTDKLEGASRPGHFRGVTTVVFLLFQMVRPGIAYFGQKDAQQLLTIKKMVKDLRLDLEIRAMPTIREPDGLAMSSRNARLNSKERKQAPALYSALRKAAGLYSSGCADSITIRQQMTEIIMESGPFQIDYISIAGADDLEEQTVVTPPCLISLAAWLGNVRLIDNILIE